MHDLVVEDIWKYGRAASEDPRLYPGRRCAYPYVLRRSSLHQLRLNFDLRRCALEVDRETVGLEAYLTSAGQTGVDDRWPLVLSDPLGTPAQQRVLRLRDLPVFPGTLRNYHAVYSGAVHGGAQVLTYARWEKHITDTIICLVDRAQLQAMGAHLGRQQETHHLAELPDCKAVIDGGPELSRVFVFVPDPAAGALLMEGAPVPVVAVVQEQIAAMRSKLACATLDEHRSVTLLPPGAVPPATVGEVVRVGSKASPIMLSDARAGP